jgi:hypothetical protein
MVNPEPPTDAVFGVTELIVGIAAIVSVTPVLDVPIGVVTVKLGVPAAEIYDDGTDTVICVALVTVPESAD